MILKGACAAEPSLLHLCHRHEKSSWPFTLDPSRNPCGAGLNPTCGRGNHVQLDAQLDVGLAS